MSRRHPTLGEWAQKTLNIEAEAKLHPPGRPKQSKDEGWAPHGKLGVRITPQFLKDCREAAHQQRPCERKYLAPYDPHEEKKPNCVFA